MSKFLKFIVHFVMLCTIICVVALTVPPFYGIETVIIDDNSEVTNLELGSVTYAIPVNITEVNLGTPLLVKDTQDGITKTYKYNLATVDLANGTGTVIDPDAAERENINVSIKNMVPKVVITIPYLGYLWVATQSIEGLIVLGLAILFLVILYVIAELWKKDAEDEEDYDDEDDEVPVKSAKELKREEKERAKRMKEEDKELLREAKNNKKKSKKEKKAARKIIKTGGFVDEIYEDELQEEDEIETSVDIQNAASEAHELLKKEIAAATADETQALEKETELEKTQNLETAARTVKKSKNEKIARQEEELIKVAVPQPTAMQLAAAAKKAGDKPDIVRDPVTKVTLFDYSDIVAENK